MAVSSYQLPSPRAITPPAGEFELAKDPNAHAAALAYYMNNRSLQEADYGRELEAAHAFALRQMIANQHDEQQKNAINLAKEAGGGDVLASPGNELGAALSPVAGVLTNLAQKGNEAQEAKNFQANMTGLNQGSQGGYQLAPGSPLPSGMPAGMSFTNLSPALVQAARINAAARLGAASIGAGGKGMGESLNVTNPVIPTAGGDIATTSSFNKIRTQADYDEAIRRVKERAEQAQRNRSGDNAPGVISLPPAPKEGDPNAILGTVPKAPGVATGPGTGTQAAPAQPTGGNTLDTNSPAGKSAQIEAKKYQDALKQRAAAGDPAAKAAYDDVNAGMSGGAFTVIVKPDNTVVIRGKSGEHPFAKLAPKK